MSRRVRLRLAAAALVLLNACASVPETRYFALGAVAAAGRDDMRGLSLAVGPVDLPRYLDRPQIVSRSGDNRLQVDEFNRWGGALEEEVVRVLGEHLAQRLGTQRIYRYPSRITADTDYRVALDIRGFDGVLGGEVRLDVAWSLIADRSGQVLVVRQGDYRVMTAGEGYEAYVAAMSEALARLGDELGDAIAATGARPSR